MIVLKNVHDRRREILLQGDVFKSKKMQEKYMMNNVFKNLIRDMLEVFITAMIVSPPWKNIIWPT